MLVRFGLSKLLPQGKQTLFVTCPALQNFTADKCDSLGKANLHTNAVTYSRIKLVQRHKPFWHIKKLNKAQDEPLTQSNQSFLQEVINDQYHGPLKQELAPWPRKDWEAGSRRCGVLAVKIGVQPLWLKNGKRIMTTMLHVTDSHVVRFIPYAEYRQSLVGEKQQRPDFVGIDPSHRGRNVHGMLVVGAQSTDPQRYTKDYCGLFTESGLMPKRHLARFPVSENAMIQPGTRLTASHFTVGQCVDVRGRTIERGFQGVMKRWGFHGMPATHGTTKSHRRPGCIGSGRDKSRVWPGQKMPGNVGGGYRWMCGLKVWRINHEDSVLYVSGPSVQGNTGSVLQVCDTRLPNRRWEKGMKGPDRFPTAFEDDELPKEEFDPLVHQFTDPSIVYA